jgi:hypothetical protein
MSLNLTACSSGDITINNLDSGQSDEKGTTDKIVATDYSLADHWLSLPATPDKAVDVFYLYPTAWQKVNDSDPNICDIDNPSMLTGAKSAYDRGGSAFATVANIYAPYYRQADAKYTLALPLDQQAEVIGGIPKTDAFAAFEYYIENYNNGRPFILAGHSQGSNILTYLLADYMKEHPEVYKRMIVAYVIGYSITEDYLAQNPHLKFATGADDTGVIISYNTEALDVVAGVNPVVWPGALVINPITWTREETLATTAEGLGSWLPDPMTKEFKQVPQYADAKIDKTKGVLVCSTANEEVINKIDQIAGFPNGVYHSFDYPFYYFNLQANAANRIDKFLKK